MPRITLFIILLFLALAAAANAVDTPSEGDCAGCHDFEQHTLVSSGGSHGSELSCLDCHPSHPPTEEPTVLACADCHDGSPHYELPGCLDCHADPHQPLKIEFAGEISNNSCASCHDSEQEALTNSGGSHGSELGCLDCHPSHPPTEEATALACADCHEGSPHYELEDCLNCHADPHQPLESLRDPIKPARQECLSCHDQIGEQMDAAPSLHAQQFCNDCHSQHYESPVCSDCHEPHQADQSDADCASCHSAHQPLKIQLAGEISNGTCASCHDSEQQTLTSSGGSHGSELGCLDCHPSHPPTEEPTALACADCHEGSPHYELEDCLNCHADPHQPLESLRDPIKPARQECLSCHDQIGEQMDAAPSLHAQQFCTDCHSQHYESPVCSDCHDPHQAGQSDADCANCHSAHQPLQIQLAGEISNKSCASCHAFIQQTLSGSGGSHGSELGCLDCHQAHPPTEEPTALACTDCHDGSPHYALNDCLHCHADPHRPLVALRDPVKPARSECLSCHNPIGVLMDEAPSQHSELFCTHCHSSHKEIPLCLDCHSPHQQDQNNAECSKCHPAHQPLKIVPTGYVSAGLCRPCHLQQADDLASTNTNHGGVNCIYCHRGQHPTVHSCQDCHGMPHATQIHSRFRDCLECHGNAHNLISGR